MTCVRLLLLSLDYVVKARRQDYIEIPSFFVSNRSIYMLPKQWGFCRPSSTGTCVLAVREEACQARVMLGAQVF